MKSILTNLQATTEVGDEVDNSLVLEPSSETACTASKLFIFLHFSPWLLG